MYVQSRSCWKTFCNTKFHEISREKQSMYIVQPHLPSLHKTSEPRHNPTSSLSSSPPSEIKRRNHSVRRKSSTWNGSRHYENSKKVHITWANFNERYGTKSRKRTEVMRIKTYVLNSDGYSQAKATNKLCRIIKSLHEKEMPMTASLSGFIH